MNLRETKGSLDLETCKVFHHTKFTMAEDSFLHLARPLGPVSVGTAPTTAPLNVVIQPQVCCDMCVLYDLRGKAHFSPRLSSQFSTTLFAAMPTRSVSSVHCSEHDLRMEVRLRSDQPSLSATPRLRTRSRSIWNTTSRCSLCT